MVKKINIKTGPHAGNWELMSASGFGSTGESAQYRRVGRGGQMLKGFAGGRNTLNLTAAQVAAVGGAA